MSVFADDTRTTDRRDMADGRAVTEYGLTATLTHQVLEDREAFAEVAERVRCAMLAELAKNGAPLNVWRLGQLNGFVDQPIDFRTGGAKEREDRHMFRLRVRAGAEPRYCQFCGCALPIHNPNCPRDREEIVAGGAG